MKDDDNDELIPGLHDPNTIPFDERVNRYAEHLREWMSFDALAKIAAHAAIALKDVEDGMELLQEQMNPLRSFKESMEEVFTLSKLSTQLAKQNTEKLMIVEREVVENKKRYSSAGAKGGIARSKKVAPLKNWAIEMSHTMRGNAAEKARKLMLKVPPEMSNTSNDPERIMREAIRSFEKNT
jgi:hypothetical protein